MGMLGTAAGNNIGGASNNRAANRAEARRQAAATAAQAASDNEPRHIDETDAANMRRKRTIDSVDVLDSMNTTLMATTNNLIKALDRNRSGGGTGRGTGGGTGQGTGGGNGGGTEGGTGGGTSSSLSGEIEELYRLRQLAANAGRQNAVNDYNDEIAELEAEARAERRARRLNRRGNAGGNGNAGGTN